MAIPRSMSWLVVTGLVVLTLVGLSIFALDRPNVIWSAGKPFCPQCRSEVHLYGKRCPSCREEFDWVPTVDDACPTCARCLSPAQDEWQRQRRRVLGDEKVAARVAAAIGIPPAAAGEYVKSLGRGQCGWCGGTGVDLATSTAERPPCPVCFGDHRCIGCGGDRRVVVGIEAASIEGARYDALTATLLASHTPTDLARSELRDAAGAFLRLHLGTVEADRLLFWPTFTPVAEPGPRTTAAGAARDRLGKVLVALEGD